MVDNKKIAETAKADPGTATRTSPASPAETVIVPTVSDVKNPATSAAKTDNIAEHVEATKKSVEAANASAEAVAKAQPFVKADEKLAKAPTADERLREQINRVHESAVKYNESVVGEKKASHETGVNTKPEVSRVAPLTGELRADPEDDSYITPGKTLAPLTPKPGEAPIEYELSPLVIAPLTGEIKRMDEVSYPTPGHVKNPDSLMSGADMKILTLDSKKTPFGVPEGHQTSLLRANEEMWKNDEAARHDQKARAAEIADALVSSDGLRRTRRAQKNLR